MGSGPGNFQTVGLTFMGVPDGSRRSPPTRRPTASAGTATPARSCPSTRARCSTRATGPTRSPYSVGSTTASGCLVRADDDPLLRRRHARRAAAGRPAVRVPRQAAAGRPVRRDPRRRPAGRLRRQRVRAGCHGPGRRLGHRAHGRAGGPRAAAPDRQHVPGARRLDLRGPRCGRGPERRLRAHVLRHAVVGAAALRRAQRLPAQDLGDQPARQLPAHVRGHGAVRGRLGGRQGHAQAPALRPLQAQGLPVQEARDLQGHVRRQGHREVPLQAAAQDRLLRRRWSRSAARTSSGPAPTRSSSRSARPAARSGSCARRPTRAAEAAGAPSP